MQALNKYKKYLEDIRDKHPEEFEEIKKINERYHVLTNEKDKLEKKSNYLQEEIAIVKDRRTKYIKDKTTEKMKLGNEITLKKAKLEEINDKKNELKSKVEEENRKKFGKYSELAQVLMAINDIQEKCEKRYEYVKKEFKSKNHANKHPVPYNEKDKPTDFNDPKKRVEYAKAQMISIEKYLIDYIKIMDGLLTHEQHGDKIRNYLQELRNQN